MSRERLDEVERLVGEIARDSITPAIRLEAYRLELDGRSLILVAVPKDMPSTTVPVAAMSVSVTRSSR